MPAVRIFHQTDVSRLADYAQPKSGGLERMPWPCHHHLRQKACHIRERCGSLQEKWFRNQAGKTARASSPQLSRILVGTNLYGLQVGAIGSLSESEHEDILLSRTEIQPAFGQEEVALVQLWASARSGKSRLAGLPLTLTETMSRVYILNNR